jgi:hypothetical protein
MSHPIRSRLDGSVVERVTSNDKVHGSIPCRGRQVTDKSYLFASFYKS